MGGLYGHIPQVWEARDLTYSQLCDIVKLASVGKLEDMHEKPDGQQLCFSYDLRKNVAVFARNNSDLISKGLDTKVLLDRFDSEGKSLVRETFEEAFNALDTATRELRHSCVFISEMIELFGIECNNWYSVEVLNVKNPNVIRYDNNMLVLHAQPKFVRAIDSVKREHNGNTRTFKKHLQHVNDGIAKIGWSFVTPTNVTMKHNLDRDVVADTLMCINDFVARKGAWTSDTVNDTCHSVLRPVFSRAQASDAAKHMAIKYALKTKSYNEFRKVASKRELAELKPYIEASPQLINQLLEPLELVLREFSKQLLTCIQPVLVKDEQTQALEIRQRVSDAIRDASGDALEVIERQLETLGSTDNILSGYEGVTFSYGGRVFKFTGSFSQVNQILGAKRYKRVVG